MLVGIGHIRGLKLPPLDFVEIQSPNDSHGALRPCMRWIRSKGGSRENERWPRKGETWRLIVWVRERNVFLRERNVLETTYMSDVESIF